MNSKMLTLLYSSNLIGNFLPEELKDIFPYISKILIVKCNTPIAEAIEELDYAKTAYSYLKVESGECDSWLIAITSFNDVVLFCELSKELSGGYWTMFKNIETIVFKFSDDPQVLPNENTVFVTIDKNTLIDVLAIPIEPRLSRISITKKRNEWYYVSYKLEDPTYIEQLIKNCTTEITNVIIQFIQI